MLVPSPVATVWCSVLASARIADTPMPSSKAAELLDYYEILGLEAGCSKSDVSADTASRRGHPDRYKGPDPEWAVAEFHRLVQAKEVLEDDKARAAFDALFRARNAHKEKQKAQEAGRKKLREELEAREADAKRQRFEPSAAEMAARQQAEEDGARAELEREIERLRRTGRLDGGAAARRDGAAGGSAGGTRRRRRRPRPRRRRRRRSSRCAGRRRRSFGGRGAGAAH